MANMTVLDNTTIDLVKQQNQVYLGKCVDVQIRKSQNKDKVDIHYVIFAIQLEVGEVQGVVYGDLALDNAKSYASQFGYDDLREFIGKDVAFKLKIEQYTNKEGAECKGVKAYALKFSNAEGVAISFVDKTLEHLFKI